MFISCRLCGGDHHINQCPGFVSDELPPPQPISVVRYDYAVPRSDYDMPTGRPTLKFFDFADYAPQDQVQHEIKTPQGRQEAAADTGIGDGSPEAQQSYSTVGGAAPGEVAEPAQALERASDEEVRAEFRKRFFAQRDLKRPKDEPHRRVYMREYMRAHRKP